MKDMKQKIIAFLLEKADPSIVLRVKKEVLNKGMAQRAEYSLVGGQHGSSVLVPTY